MGLRLSILVIALNSLFAHQALFLIQSGDVEKGIQAYLKSVEKSQEHDFEVLEQMGHILLEQGANSSDPETQLLSIFGSGIAQKFDNLAPYEKGLLSPNPMTQMAAIQFLGQHDDDRTSQLLGLAMNSQFLAARLEAAYYLAMRKNPQATEQLEALMFKLPPFFRVYFPEFFALIGTPKAISLLKQLMGDQELLVRNAALLSAADFGRDDLISYMRAAATHKNPAEQEVSAISLGRLGDTHSKETIRKMCDSPYENVRLAAFRSLYMLGETEQFEHIATMAKKGDLLAILALSLLPDAAATLKPLLQSNDRDQKLNTALGLLQCKDPACLPIIAELLTAPASESAIEPLFSTGRAQSAWRFVPPSERYVKLAKTDVLQLTLNLKHRILKTAIDLPEKAFLELADILFYSRVIPLIPSLVQLLENHKSPGAINLLKTHANAIGSPLIRSYCNLALFRLQEEGPYQNQVVLDTLRLKDTELIRFQPSAPKSGQSFSPFALTPEETSQLLIECCQTLAMQHTPKSLNILLEAIGSGHPQNRYALAGLLLKALE